jgi:endonuclease/exonuclease/phosphatase family metal-dependent hydrolase
LEYCGDLFDAASVGCQSCVAANIGNPIEVIMEMCVGGSGSAAYDGHNGLLMLMKNEPSETHHLQFSSALTTRSALHAKVKVGGLGEADLFCTHLAADLSNILAYPGTEYGSYIEEQNAQIQGLMQFAEEKSSTEHTILLGDMNTGPDDIPENYQLFTDAGYANAYVEANGESRCTFCNENTLISGDGEGGVTIDHVLTQTTATATATARVIDTTASIETSDGPTDHNLSDHYGVQVTLER